jgi:hypothetical protein
MGEQMVLSQCHRKMAGSQSNTILLIGSLRCDNKNMPSLKQLLQQQCDHEYDYVRGTMEIRCVHCGIRLVDDPNLKHAPHESDNQEKR